MKYLEVSKGKGYFLNSQGVMKEIDKITKEDILRLLGVVTDVEQTFEMDPYDDKDDLANEAHRIIYSHIYKKISELIENKTRFHDESASMYKDALAKYKSNSDSN